MSTRTDALQAHGMRTRRGRIGRPRRWTVVLVVVLAVPMLLIAAVPVILNVMTARATDRLVETAQVLLVDTPYEDTPAESLRQGVGGGNVLCMDNCLYLDLEVPATYASTVEANMARAGWSVDIPGCLTEPERSGPPCGLMDEEGRSIGLASYWPGPGLFLMIGPG